MTYELAKQLKDAGFPNIRLCERPDEHKISECGECASEHKPTLSELIEACMEHIPDKFLDIKSREYTSDQWVATSSMKITGGSTPQEAVARLWLELNKK